MKPILFNTENVRAILEGRKTVTRRVCKPGTVVAIEYEQPIGGQPYYKGDILWVRETWNCGYIETSDAEYSHEAWFEEMTCPTMFSRFWYRADADDERTMAEVGGSWRPSIHMPREAARIFLRVTDVRVERLQDIDERGALDEGGRVLVLDGKEVRTARKDFALIWDETIKKIDLPRYGWEANPWVWVISFERISKEEAERDG